jgi:hypothetical protein
MIIAIDYDGTYSRDPLAFYGLVILLRGRGHTCVMVTGRSDEGRWGAEVRNAVGDLMPIVFAAGAWKATAAERAGFKVDVWVDDKPEGVRELRADYAEARTKRTDDAAPKSGRGLAPMCKPAKGVCCITKGDVWHTLCGRTLDLLPSELLWPSITIAKLAGGTYADVCPACAAAAILLYNPAPMRADPDAPFATDPEPRPFASEPWR